MSLRVKFSFAKVKAAEAAKKQLGGSTALSAVRQIKAHKIHLPEVKVAPTPLVAPAKPQSRQRLDRQNHDPKQQIRLAVIVTRVVALAQALAEKKFYPYQVELTFRIVESLLLHDGEVLTALMGRQMGKSESVGAIVSAIALILPFLAKKYPLDWKLNLTDENGVYRGYAFGVKIGIYAPKKEQASMLFERVKRALATDTAKQVITELKITQEERNGNTVRLSNGSSVLCESASEQSKIEGATHHLLIAEEAQEISDQKMRKSLHPMVAATLGTIVKIGTATTYSCDFYTSIRLNERVFLVTSKRNHFFFPWQVGAKYNSLYRDYIDKEKIRLGEDSDEFQTSYCGKWIFERGMFATNELLFNRNCAQTEGIWSVLHPFSLPRAMRNFSIVVGIDWGSSNDSTVLTFTAVDWSSPFDAGIAILNGEETNYTYYKKHVIGWLEFKGDNYEYQFGEITQLLGRIPNLRKIVTDSNTCGKPIFDRLQATFAGRNIEVVPFNFQPKIKSDGYKSLYSDLCGHRITFPAAKEVRVTREYQKFIQQMTDLRKDYRQGIMTVAHPDVKGAHDDYPDSLMMANWGANATATANKPTFYASNPFTA